MVKQKRKQSLSNENGSSSKQKWVKGPLKLEEVFQQPPGSKLQLFWNDNGQPCGPDTHPSLYSKTIGVLITTSQWFNWTKSWDKQFLDQTPEEAPEQPPGEAPEQPPREAPEQPPREAPEQPKDRLWRKIKEYWEVDDTRKKYTLSILGSEIFRSKKCKWKKDHYSCYDTYDDVVANKPECLSYQEWAILTRHWETEEHQVLSHRNKGTRAAQMAQQASGKISSPQLRKKIDKMTEPTGRDEHGAENSITDDIYDQVMPPDRHRRVRQQGRGVTPSSSNHNGAALRIEQLENELAEMRRQTQEKEEQRKQEFDQLTRSFEVQIEKMQRNFDEQSKTMEERILQTLIQRTANLHHIGQITTAGNEAFQSGRHSEAVEHYTSALSCNLESRLFAAICFCNRAAAHQALGQIADAIADCSLAIALDGSYVMAISRRATLHEMIKDFSHAALDLQRLVCLLEKQAEEKVNQSGKLGRSTRGIIDLKQAYSRLSTAEEEARKGISLDLYLILGMESSSMASDIKKAYRKAALRHHPDKVGQVLPRIEIGDDGVWKEIAEEVHKDADRLFKMIGEAYAVLSDPAKRYQYDEEEIRYTKKGNGCSTSRTPSDAYSSPFESSSSSRRQGRSYRNQYQ